MKLAKDADRIIKKFIQTRVNEAGAKGVVIGLSGGIDSATTLALAVSALGNEKVYGLILPSHDSESITIATNHAETLGVKTKKIDISSIVKAYKDGSDTFSHRLAEGNLNSRIRMTLLYGESFVSNFLVAGTSNKSELLLGYYTKWGDGASDFLPIGDLYKSQVYLLADLLDIPIEIIQRPPTAELWEGQTDEADLGMNYRELDVILEMIENFSSVEKISSTTSMNLKDIQKIEDMIRFSIHKRIFPSVCKLGYRTVGIDWRETLGTFKKL